MKTLRVFPHFELATSISAGGCLKIPSRRQLTVDINALNITCQSGWDSATQWEAGDVGAGVG